MRDYDAIVIGGGCGGASAAFFLRYYSLGRAMKTLLIERLEGGKFSRYHRMCGEAISRAAFRDIRPIKPSGILNEVKRLEEHWPGGYVLRERAKGYILDRPRFIEDVTKMYDRLEGERTIDTVTEVAPTKEGFLLKCSSGEALRTKFLIGADGAHSLVRRKLFDEQPSYTFQMEQFVVQKSLPKNTLKFFHDQKYSGGYRWEFPYGELAKIGFPKDTDSLEGKVIEKHRRDIPVGGLTRLVRGNACLVGDAAAQVNPLTAGGIRVSMLAGKHAAWAIVAENLDQYESWWQGSKFSSSDLLIALRHLQKLNNDDLTKIFGPLTKGIPYLSYLSALRTMPEFRDIYEPYMRAGKLGW